MAIHQEARGHTGPSPEQMVMGTRAIVLVRNETLSRFLRVGAKALAVLVGLFVLAILDHFLPFIKYLAGAAVVEMLFSKEGSVIESIVSWVVA